MTQQELAKMLKTSISVVGRYERDEMTPSIEVAKKVADFLDATVGYLLDETGKADLFKDPSMFQRFKDIAQLDEKSKEHVIFAIDSMIKSVKLQSLA